MKRKLKIGRPKAECPRERIHNFRLTEEEARTFRANVLVRGTTISRIIRERLEDLLVARDKNENKARSGANRDGAEEDQRT